MARRRGKLRRLQGFFDAMPADLVDWWKAYIDAGMYHMGTTVTVMQATNEEAEATKAVRDLLRDGDSGVT